MIDQNKHPPPLPNCSICHHINLLQETKFQVPEEEVQFSSVDFEVGHEFDSSIVYHFVFISNYRRT